MAKKTHEAVYLMLNGEDDGRVCRDIPESACVEQPRNFLTHVVSLAATKTGDGFADPKLVLSWLLSSLGAPVFLIGLLVPIREAGALLPQLVIAGGIRSLPQRKWVWTTGSAIQGLAVIGMGLAAFLLDGVAAGWTIVGLLAVLSIARSSCSVSYKDVLGKTVSKSTRGTATGTASTIAAVAVLGFGLALSFGLLEKSVSTIAAVLFIAGGMWLVAAALFATLAEEAGATDGGGNPLQVAIEQLGLLKKDAQLRRFIATRSLLLPTALAPPYMLALSGSGASAELGELGLFVLASGLASMASTYVWGRLSDKSSRKVLIFAALIGAAALGSVWTLAVISRDLLQYDFVMPALLFVLLIGYQGVRLGRSTHITDMATPDTRAAYTALSNTIVGLALISAGLFGLLAEQFGEHVVLATFALLCLMAAIVAGGLAEVQAEDT